MELSDEMIARLRAIKLIVFDFDGVMTDNTVMVSEIGEESVVCSRADGLGVSLLRKLGLDLLILSTEVNKVVAARAVKLEVRCYQGHANKGQRLVQEMARLGLQEADVAYVGNDVNDLECLQTAGVSICVQDAHSSVKGLADLVTTASGGRGAVREIADWFLAVCR